MRNSLRAMRVLVSLSFRADPWRATGFLVLTAGSLATFALVPLWYRVLTDHALHHDARGAIFAAAMIGAISLLGITAIWSGFMMRMRLDEQVGLRIDQHVMTMSSTVETLEVHERPDVLDRFALLREQRDALVNCLASIVYNIGFFSQLAVTTVLLESVHPLLLLLPLFGIPSVWTAGRSEAMFERHRQETAEPHRLADHYFALATTPPAGKEIRVFGLAPEIERRYGGLWHDLVTERGRIHLRTRAQVGAGWFVFGLGYAGALVLVADQVVRGRATPGEMVLTVALAAQVNQQVGEAARNAMFMARGLKVVERFAWLIDFVRESEQQVERVRAEAGGAVPVPERLRAGIRFDGVAFAYPGTERAVLEDVNLQLPAGSIVAIVGDNGAGKSTLVKLLCRFYSPVAGRVLIDNTDLARFDAEEWRACVSAGFQDFVKPELVAREVVGIGDLGAMHDEHAVQVALERAAAGDLVGQFPAGFDTQLGRSFPNGQELSGGQWQKLAIGRGMMRREPLLLVLDEPTASLDAETEHTLFERYAAAAHDIVERTGGITILVSHRFSTVRMADLIVVIGDGTVTEFGTHAELMRRGGTYSELYELQARAYR